VRLKLDENLGLRAQIALRGSGHDVSTVLDQRLSGTSDQSLIEVCTDERRVLVTLDLDFANPLRFKPDATAGIVVLRLPAHPTPDDLDTAVQTLTRGLTVASVERKLWVVQRGTIREHQSSDLEPDP